MANTKGTQVKEAPEEDNARAEYVLAQFETARTRRKHKRRQTKGLVRALWVLVTIPVFMGLLYLGITPVDQPITSPESVIAKIPVANHEENLEQQAPEPEVVVVEPTIRPGLLADPGDTHLSVQTGLSSSFKKQITLHVQPANVGLIPTRTGNPIFDAVVAMKYALGNTNSPQDMDAIMQVAGEMVRVNAQAKDPFAVALRQATFMEFQKGAQNAIAEIPTLREEQFPPAIRVIAYYARGMWYTALTENDFAEWEDAVARASNAFDERWKQIEAQKAAQAIPGANPKPEGQAIPESNANPAPASDPDPNVAPEPDPKTNPNPAPDSYAYAIPEAEYRTIEPQTNAVALKAPTLTDYSSFPSNIAAPLEGFSGWSLNPEGVVLVVQQLESLLKTGTAGPATEWVVFNVHGMETPAGTAWLFTIMRRDTLDTRWSELSSECQDYMGPLLVDPSRPEASDLRSRWGANACANDLGGVEFNEGHAILDITYPSGKTDWILHTGPDGQVDFMSAMWFGFGNEFPLKVGNRFLTRSLLQIGEGLFKDLLDLLP